MCPGRNYQQQLSFVPLGALSGPLAAYLMLKSGHYAE